MRQAQQGDTVRVHFSGMTKDGSVLISSLENGVVEFTIGEGDQIQGLEQAVIGMTPGEKKRSEVPVEKGYGPYHEELVTTIDCDQLPDGLEPDVGQILMIDLAQDKTVTVWVREISDSTITVDANHPLAGKDLLFDIELVGIVDQ
jgi:peptidylprolyl isomerase